MDCVLAAAEKHRGRPLNEVVRRHLSRFGWTKTIGATLALAALGGCSYLWLEPMKTVRVTQGTAGEFDIGETKEQILSRLPSETFSPQPKPTACPMNWLKVSTLSQAERACLLSSDMWIEGVSSTRSLCPSYSDVSTKLYFVEGKLARVETDCMRPK